MEWGLRTKVAMIIINRSILIHLSVVLLQFSCILAVNAQPDDYDEYHVTLDEELNYLNVMACFNTSLPASLNAGSSNAASLIQATGIGKENSQQAPLRPGTRIKLSANSPCTNYQVDFNKLKKINNRNRLKINPGNTLASKAGDWLWLPADKPRTIRIHFTLPEGILISSPWHLISRTAQETIFELDTNDDVIESLVYIGRFSLQEIKVKGAVIRLAIIGQLSGREIDKLTDWIRYGAKSMVALYGYYPLADPQIVVFPIGPYDSAVPWGEVQREGGCVSNLYVDQTRPLKELINDWTLIHELSHMIHPYISMDGRWLSEGIATYYQNVLQARVGTLSEEQAWIKLHQGFVRGKNETDKEVPLIEVSFNMHENHKHMRVYWSGVALAFKADWMLRSTNNGSLDTVLQRFQECCLYQNRSWTPVGFINKLDELSNSKIFSELYEEYAYSDQFPDLQDVYDSLGLGDYENKIELSKEAGAVNLRQAIMTRRIR